MLRSLYISRFFFIAFALGVIFIVMGFYIPSLLYVGQFSLIVLFLLTLLDGLILFGKKKPILAQRRLPKRLDLGEDATIEVAILNIGNQPYRVGAIDQPPDEMQARNLSFFSFARVGKKCRFSYVFCPTKRGTYKWKNIHVFVSSFLGLLERRIIFSSAQEVPVYPSVLQMKNFEFLMFNRQTQQRGIKKLRRLGHNNEFEQIKPYVQGDDIRTINWKATSRTSQLMVNQYQEQRSQSVYAIIDKSRPMEHEFNGLTLLDHAINSVLVFSNIAIRKGDKMGLLTFSHKMGAQIAPNNGRKQLQLILDLLYAQKTAFKEANYPLLYLNIRKSIPYRSLLMLYTNFETELSMRRALPMLKRISKKHVLVVVLFENTDLDEVLIKKPSTLRSLYVSTLAENVINIKKRIASELKKNGIYTVLTTPDELNVNTINKYLELKSKGVI